MDGHRATGQLVAHRIPLTGCLTIATTPDQELCTQIGRRIGVRGTCEEQSKQSAPPIGSDRLDDRELRTQHPREHCGRDLAVIAQLVHVGSAHRFDGVAEVTGDRREGRTLGEHRAGAPVPQAVELVSAFADSCRCQGGAPHR